MASAAGRQRSAVALYSPVAPVSSWRFFPCDLSSLMSPTKGIDFHFVQFFFFFCKDGSDYLQTLYTSELKLQVSSLAFFIQLDNLLLIGTFRPFTFLV